MGVLVGNIGALPLSFYLELALVLPLGLTVLVTAGAIQRAQRRRAYHQWQGWSERTSRR